MHFTNREGQIMEKVIIVVPLYKNDLNDMEKISLYQMLKVLKRYHKCFIIPEGLDVSNIELDATCEIVPCSPEWFKGVASYSLFLLSTDFYKMFLKYQYLLIYQLDAFVFRDELEVFCNLGYDYIGAPWFRSTIMYKYSKAFVGNGGLCLRHVRRTIKVLDDNYMFIKEYFVPKLKILGEDVVFAYLGKNGDYKVAPASVAKKFSLECNFQHSYDKLDVELPFGCHHWWNGDYDVWKNHIIKCGYSLEEKYSYTREGQSIQTRIKWIVRYLLKRILRGGKERFFVMFSKLIPNDKKIIVWGKGILGKECINFLTDAGIKINYIIDKRGTNNECINGIMVINSDEFEFAQDNIVIVATSKYYQEIGEKLKQVGLKEDKNFISFDKLKINIVKNYYGIDVMAWT